MTKYSRVRVTSGPFAVACLLMSALIACAPGCGGSGGRSTVTASGGTSAPAASRVGRATFTVTWPAPSPTRLIPSAANSIVIRITRPDGTALAEQRMSRPAGGGPTTASFADLPVGDVVARVSAYPNPDGTGIAQASASASVTIEAGRTAALALSLASTIDRLDVTPSPLSMTVGDSVSLAVAAKNSAGEIVLTDPAKITYVSRTTGAAPGAVAAVDSAGKVTARASGPATITVTEAESGKTAVVSVMVAAPALPIPQQSVSYQIDASHSGRAVFGQPLKFPSEPTWSVPITGSGLNPVIADGRIFVLGTVDKENGAADLYAFDRATGTKLWGPVSPGQLGLEFIDAVTFDSGRLIVHGYTDLIEALPTLEGINPANGSVAWRVQTPPYCMFIATRPLVAANGTVFLGFINPEGAGAEWAVDSVTGAVRWKRDFKRDTSGGPETAAPADNLLFVVHSNRINAVDSRTGADVWELDSEHSLNPAIYNEGKLYSQQYARGEPSAIAAILNAKSGAAIGTYAWDEYLSPVFLGNTGFFATVGSVKAVDLSTRQTLWTLPNVKTVFSPVLIDETLITVGTDGTVRALNAKTGALLWQGKTAGIPSEGSVSAGRRSGVAAGEGYLAVPSRDHLTVWHLAGPK